MRNLKKLFAVLLAVAMIASMMVPALAGSYEAEGIKLQTIGLVAGDSPEQLDLDREMKRIEAVAFTIRAAGKESEALSMTDEEVDEILADWKDAADLPSWPNDNARRYAAYAIKAGIVKGVSATEKIFAPNALVKGIDFLVLLLKSAFGYADVQNVDPTADNYVVDVALDAGILSATMVVYYTSKAALIRDDAIYILYSAAMDGVNADGDKLIDALIEAGAVDAAKAAEAGFVAAAPSTPEALKATATNLKEIVVTFNTELDKDTAEDEANYSVYSGADKTIESVRLNDDKKSVTIALDDADILANQADYKVTVETGVKSAAGVALAEDVELTGSVFDVTIPVALSAEQSGPQTFKVKFSEPVKATTDNFKVDNGSYFIESIDTADNYYSVEVKLYATLPNGEHKVEVSGVEDYAGYKIVTTTLTFVAAKDEVAPAVAKVVSASPEKVELEMTEAVYFVVDEAAAIAGIYHTNAINNPTDVDIDGKIVTLTFDADHKLPNGTAYLTIAKELFKDAWGNKNAKVEDLAITVTADKVKPTVKSIKAETDKKVVIEFSEKINAAGFKYTLLDATGKDVKSANPLADVDGTVITDTKVTLNFKDALAGSSFTFVIEGVKDLAGNEMDKVSLTVAVTDTTGPKVVEPSEIYKTKRIIKVKFNEVMKTEDILNLANYQSNGIYLSETKAKATIADGGKAVLIDYSKVTESISLTQITVGRVRDAAGNFIDKFATTVTLDDVDYKGILITKVEATGVKTLVVTLSDALSKFEKNDFVIVGGQAVGVTFANNADGKGVVTFTLKDELDTDLDTPVTVATAATTASENSLGVKVKENQSAQKAEDKIPATIAKIEFTSATAITITFSEKVNTTTLSKATFEVSGNTVTSVKITENDIVLNLKDAVSLNTKVTVTQKISFEDQKENVTTGLEKEVERK